MAEALDLAALTAEDLARVDYAVPFADWPNAEAITKVLINNYARLLNIQVAGEVEDYLLWNGIDIAATYAASTIEPDVEHLCLGMLVLEGVATDLATANWDGLIERAVDELTGSLPCLVVCVRREDLQEPAQQAWLYKFHGCAVRAVGDEDGYRRFLIGRASQINGWVDHAEHHALVSKIVGIIISKPTLMMGLSAQDANIQALFARAENQSPWAWPGDRPSVVFSGDRVGADQQGMLQNVYRATMNPGNRQQVMDGSLVRAYAKPLLIALTLHVLCAKLHKLVEIAPSELNDVDRAELQAGINALRDHVAAGAEDDRLVFIRALVDQSSRFISLYRDGHAGAAPRPYHPLTDVPLHRIETNAAIPASGLRELAVAMGILGLGARGDHWTLAAPNLADPQSGVIRMTSTLGSTSVLFAANSNAALRLQHNGHVAAEAILVHSDQIVPTMARSPRIAPGRTGRVGLRQVSVTELLSDAANTNDLVQRFREAVAI
ncbi:SIR2 family protein [Luteimonas kalidii]|uniref:SIR2 family protein n=1 Tax=Luteimonas kalidii TaxID=3042025 RepID=A0ABT6JXA7_9GAMM|nr:SIR2 family protein [Luteimonas kalidii]MDH5835327.1 SIR2 family protein [Luteimonas kalidii]